MASKIIKANPFAIGKLVQFIQSTDKIRVVLITGIGTDSHFAGVVVHTFPEDATHVGYCSTSFIRSAFQPFTDNVQLSNG